MTTPESSQRRDEAALVSALKQGDLKAFREAVVRYSPQMLAAARGIVGADQAEDIVQEAWMTVYRKVGDFEHRSALATWLQRIVSNQAISHLRKHGRETPLPEASVEGPVSDWFDARGHWASPPPVWDTGSPDELLFAAELQNCIDKHLGMMPENQRLVVSMRDVQLQAMEDICNELGLSASNVRVLLHRGRLRLMNMVNGFRETGSC